MTSATPAAASARSTAQRLSPGVIASSTPWYTASAAIAAPSRIAVTQTRSHAEGSGRSTNATASAARTVTRNSAGDAARRRTRITAYERGSAARWAGAQEEQLAADHRRAEHRERGRGPAWVRELGDPGGHRTEHGDNARGAG